MDDVLTELRIATESIDRYGSAQRRHNDATDQQIALLWEAIAEGRDELLAVANRLQALTNAAPFVCAPDESAGLREVRDAGS